MNNINNELKQNIKLRSYSYDAWQPPRSTIYTPINAPILNNNEIVGYSKPPQPIHISLSNLPNIYECSTSNKINNDNHDLRNSRENIDYGQLELAPVSENLIASNSSKINNNEKITATIAGKSGKKAYCFICFYSFSIVTIFMIYCIIIYGIYLYMNWENICKVSNK